MLYAFFLRFSYNVLSICSVAKYRQFQFSSITDLFTRILHVNMLHDRSALYRKVLGTHISRAMRYNILPLGYFSASELCDFILLLLSLDIDFIHISYSELVSMLVRGLRYRRYGNDEDAFDSVASARARTSKNMRISPKYEYERGSIGIIESDYFDLSFFLILNYDIALYDFFVFCRFIGADNITLSNALLLLESTYHVFIKDHFISAVCSVSDSLYINNVCYADNYTKLVAIGDLVEVRKNNVFTDLFITICNVTAQCK